MADIQSLAIRGIRSFGTDDIDEQRISFNKPLTLILGQNGCGKTTIIECLRYAITGQMPPGSRNECFVHDAKVNGTTEVLGQVKLKICNAKDKQIEVNRSMKVTALANKKTRFQTLDSLLSIADDDGNKKDIRSRCADVDSYIHAELGVPKAILNSVVFCHQEDSSWPLDEGKKVKERFDEIFDADKYSDCFDRLKKIRKECNHKITMLEQEVAHLTDKKEDLNKKKLDVVNTETRISESELKIAELTQQLKPITEKINAIDALEKNLLSFETKKETAKAKLEHAKTEEQEMKTSIKNVFEGTTDELKENINSYEAVLKTKQKELSDSNKKNILFNKEEEKIAHEKSSNEFKFNRLILSETQNQERIDKRNKMIVEIAKTAEVDVLPEITADEEAAKGINDLTEKVENLKKEFEEMKSQADSEEKSMQSLIDESRDALSRHQQKISSKETEIKTVSKELIKKEKEVNVATESKNKFDELEKKIATAEEEYRQTENEMNIEESQKEINDDEKGMEQHEQELEVLNEKVIKLQKQSAKLKEREMIEESLKQKEKQYTILINKHKASITQLLGTVPENNFAVSINKIECEVRNEVETMKKKRKTQEKEVTKLETERKHVREILNERRSELTKAEDQMYKACGTQSYDATLSKVISNVEKLQEEQNVLQSSMFIFAKYKTQLKDNSCCPLCNRGFDSESEAMDLITQLTTQVMNVPAKLEKATEELQRASAKKDELLSLKSINEKILSLKEKDIPEFEKRLTDIDKQIQSLNESLEDLSMSLIEPEQKLNTAKQIQGEMPLLDRYNQDIKTATKDLETVKAQCADLDSELSLDEATAKQTDLRQKIATLRSRIKSANTKINQHNKKLQKMAEKKNKLKEDQLKIQKKIQEICSLQEQLKQLGENKEKFQQELKELQNNITTFKAAVNDKEQSKSECVKKNREAIEAKRTYINKVLSAFDKVKTLVSEIKEHEERNVQREMDKIKEANDRLMEKQNQIKIDKELLAKKIDALKDEFAKQEIYKRNLTDNLRLRKAQANIETYEKEIAEIEEEMNGLNREELKEKQSLIKEQMSLFKQKVETEGSLKELKDRLKHVKTELLCAQSKNIEQMYRQKNYELHVSKAIDKDIRLYSVALEKCLMEFHREKMENINLIIREMWRKIYRGNDIDYIEIKTEGSMTDNMERRKYDYRVVQCKNNVEIDMRGRCSAGQKVLACLIIRLALAETFSSRFGILALDEPTTNLDEENIRSLCQTLGEIVQDRMSQKNFMFIIITHDKEFIESLGNIDKVTHYYEVSRNDEGKSRIKKIKFT